MAKEFSLESYLAAEETTAAVEYKENKYIIMPECFQKAIGFPGILLGTSSMYYGLSDSGKTVTALHIAKASQDQGVIPFLIITENKLDMKLVEKVGLDLTKCVLKEDLTTLEDVYDYISMKITHLKSGKLPKDIIFIWDSVASTPSRESFEIDKDGKITKKYGPQKNAAVIGYFNPIIMKMITSTRQKECKNTAGLVVITQGYVKPPEFVGGMSSIVANGGEKIWYPLSLAVELKEGKRLKTIINGREYEYSLVVKFKVKKNHLSDLNSSGEVVFAGNEMFENDEKLIKDYKIRHKDEWEKVLGEDE